MWRREHKRRRAAQRDRQGAPLKVWSVPDRLDREEGAGEETEPELRRDVEEHLIGPTVVPAFQCAIALGSQGSVWGALADLRLVMALITLDQFAIPLPIRTCYER